MRTHKRASLQTCNIYSGSFLGFSPVPSPEMVQDRDVSPCGKIFSTVFTNSVFYQRAIVDGSAVVDGANNRPCCASGGPVAIWTFDGTARTNTSPASWIPKSESEHIPYTRQSMSMDLADGPGPGGIPVKFLRN